MLEISEYPNGGFYAYFSIGEKRFYAHLYDVSKMVLHCLPLVHPIVFEVFACNGDTVLEDKVLMRFKFRKFIFFNRRVNPSSEAD